MVDVNAILSSLGTDATFTVETKRIFDAAISKYAKGGTQELVVRSSPLLRQQIGNMSTSVIYIAGKQPFNPYKGAIVTFDGKSRWVVTEVAPLSDKDGIVAYRLQVGI